MDAEKIQSRVAVQPVHDQTYADDDSVQNARWITGVFRRLPWIGLAAIFATIGAAASAFAILRCSKDVRTDHWGVKNVPAPSPNVLLSIVNSITNLVLLAAVGQGYAIAWWRRALEGSTVTELHRSWSFSSSTLSILTSLKSFNTIALAALMTKLTILDGVLLQKATSTYLAYDTDGWGVDLKAYIATELPHNYTGIMYGANDTASLYTPEFLSVMTAYRANGGLIDFNAGNAIPINFNHSDQQYYDPVNLPQPFGVSSDYFQGCSGSCWGNVNAAGLWWDCANATEPWAANVSLSASNSSQAYPLFSTSFSVNWYDQSANSTTIKARIAYVNSVEGENGTCPGVLTTQTCVLRPAVVTYGAWISDENNVTDADSSKGIGLSSNAKAGINLKAVPTTLHGLTRPDLYSFPATQLANYASLVETPGPNRRTTMGGIELALNTLFASSASIEWTGPSTGWSLTTSGSTAPFYFSADSSVDVSSLCNYTLPLGVDPATTTIKTSLDEILFRTSLHAAMDGHPATVQQLTGTNQMAYRQYYKSDYRWLGGAVASMLLAILGIAPSYYGFWQLGRRVTLGPFEIASALQAPILEHPAVASGQVDDLIEHVGDRRVQYGLVPEVEQPKLVMAEPDRVARPAYGPRGRR
ncbi:hypothetical protein B0A49_09920 [Cryomyces minteri]|uniref:Uncharacterized protein n=1 Tax=Cryomyces minteri TaxID=331657 RepID=A0A4U0WK47_9PEZI|nr:hypothetical protein B0A49_09920 [Cryomyces minteri]